MIDDKGNLGAILISYDLSRAFDEINHNLLLHCLQNANFSNGFILWIQNYLKGRTAKIRAGSDLSKCISLNKGVPQGSVLSPALFSIFTNCLISDSPDVVTVKFADDVNIVVPLKTTDEAEIVKSINRETHKIWEWCSKNKLVLNTNKSKMMIVTKQGRKFSSRTPIPRVQEMRVLGVLFNEKMNWKSHI